ncbi:MAG: SMP-30/gluconolactonase/LRE family protein [Planctomycetota bacterium]
MHYAVAFLLLTGVAAGAAAGPGADGLFVSEVETVAEGLRFTEGPAWSPEGYLVFSDIPADMIYRLTEEGREVFRRPSGHSNGLAFDAEGRLLACEHGNRRVSITRKGGAVETLAGRYEGKRLNSPNDLVVHTDGSVYFTDPPYGVDEENRELDFQGVYRIGPDGKLTLLVDDFVKPNGLALSPDEKTLYVADTDRHQVRAFDLREDGTLANGRTLVRVEPPEQLRPDGMKVDVEGNLYVAGVGGVWVFDPEGRKLTVLELPQRPANLAFAGPEGRTLYITARSAVYRVRTRHAGVVVGGPRRIRNEG